MAIWEKNQQNKICLSLMGEINAPNTINNLIKPKSKCTLDTTKCWGVGDNIRNFTTLTYPRHQICLRVGFHEMQ